MYFKTKSLSAKIEIYKTRLTVHPRIYMNGNGAKQALIIYVYRVMKQFDCIIAGAGSAGLTLAYALLVFESSKKTIAIIEKDQKSSNDRTWCFWEKGINPLENLVYKQWNKAGFRSKSFDHNYDISPYQYKMIRGIDFYQFMKTELSNFSNLTWINESILSISDDGKVKTELAEYQGKQVFSCIKGLKDFEIDQQYVQFLQHFKGYFIETKKPQFDPDTFTYMDFRIDQSGDCRFGYVLPFSSTEALVEYTIFSEQLLPLEEYDEGVKNYIADFLKIEEYEIKEEEFGVIPMTDFPFPKQQSDCVFNIGISGGFAKPSTGYTFLRSQKAMIAMAKNIEAGISPFTNLPYQSSKFKAYDSTLLNVLKKGDHSGEKIFSDLFEKNGAQAVFKFLDEETNLKEELKIMSSTPIMAFGSAFIKSILK